MRRVLLTGGAGYVGRAVLAALRRPGIEVAGLVHRRAAAVDATIAGDLGDPATLRGCCADAEVVLHVAAHVHDDAVVCDRVNAEGTRALVAEARRAGVARLVYVSSAAVYGMAEHDGAREDQCVVAPVTPISRSRAAAERAVLDAGGAVVRPLFVYGRDDERFLPAVIRGLRRLPFLVERGRARISVIGVGDLGRAVADLALAETPPTGVYHATDGFPVRFADLATALRDALGVPVPRGSLPWPIARRVVRWLAPRLTGDVPASAEHRLFLIARDHHYDAERLWSAVGWRPEEGLLAQIPALVEP